MVRPITKVRSRPRMSPSFAPASINAAMTRVYAVIASWTPEIVVSRSLTICEIDTFMTLLSSTITNCAAASTEIGSQTRRVACSAIRPIVRATGRRRQWRAPVSRGDARTYAGNRRAGVQRGHADTRGDGGGAGWRGRARAERLRSMFGATAKLARRLRDCRACGSRAIAGPYADDVDDETIELSVRCGECGTWRSEVMLFHRAGAVGSRL